MERDMRIALDTNILVYAEGVNGALRAKTTVGLIKKLPESSTFLPVQVLGELFRILVGKSALPPPEARAIVLDTNILVYAEGVNGALRAKTTVGLIKKLPESSTFLPVQVLGELFRILVGKSAFPPPE